MVTQGGTICYDERYASWMSFFAQAREHQKLNATTEAMERVLDHLKSRLTGVDILYRQ